MSLSNVIKATDGSTNPVVRFDFDQVDVREGQSPPTRRGRYPGLANRKSEAERLEDLEVTIQNRLLDAERKAQELEEEAYRKGYAQGQKDGFEIGQKSMTILRDHLEKLLHGLANFPERMFAEYREWLIHTCMEVSHHVVRRELTGDVDQLVKLIDALLKEAQEGYAVTLHINPHDLDLLEKQLDFQELAVSLGRTLHLKPDSQLERGGCRMESDIQLLDASIDQQFALIADAIRAQQSLPDIDES
jgi:flagellar assembly protein FliH